MWEKEYFPSPLAGEGRVRGNMNELDAFRKCQEPQKKTDPCRGTPLEKFESQAVGTMPSSDGRCLSETTSWISFLSKRRSSSSWMADNMPRPRHAMPVRDGGLQGRGYKVLRFWDNEIFQNTEGVLEVIRKNVL